MQERRASPRQKTLLAGKIVYNGGQVVFDCMVREMSENGTGARLTFGDVAAVPEQFDLHITSKGTVHRAQVKWRRIREVGVQLEKVAPKVAAAAPAPKPATADPPKADVAVSDPPKPDAAPSDPSKPVVAASDPPKPVAAARDVLKLTSDGAPSDPVAAAGEPPKTPADAPVA
jgi:PilZ domain-containing protein